MFSKKNNKKKKIKIRIEGTKLNEETGLMEKVDYTIKVKQ